MSPADLICVVGLVLIVVVARHKIARVKREASRPRTIVQIPKHYQAIGSPPLERHYGRKRVGL